MSCVKRRRRKGKEKKQLDPTTRQLGLMMCRASDPVSTFGCNLRDFSAWGSVTSKRFLPIRINRWSTFIVQRGGLVTRYRYALKILKLKALTREKPSWTMDAISHDDRYRDVRNLLELWGTLEEHDNAIYTGPYWICCHETILLLPISHGNPTWGYCFH